MNTFINNSEKSVYNYIGERLSDEELVDRIILANKKHSEYKSINNDKFKLVSSDGTEFFLTITSDMDIDSEQAIIVYESASGDGGITINNGRLQESIPVSGWLLEKDSQSILEKCAKLTRLKEQGEPIDFVTPFEKIREGKGNKFFIQRVTFNMSKSTPTAVPFSMVLTEHRIANTRTTAINLVNYQSAEFMKRYYFQLIGNI